MSTNGVPEPRTKQLHVVRVSLAAARGPALSGIRTLSFDVPAGHQLLSSHVDASGNVLVTLWAKPDVGESA